MRLSMATAFVQLRRVGLIAGLAVLAGCGVIAVYESLSLIGAKRPAPAQVASAVLYEDDFVRDLQSGRMFRKSRGTPFGSSYDEGRGSQSRRRFDPNEGRNRLGVPPNPSPTLDERRPKRSQSWGISGTTYRTVCVRLCDGSYFPISASTSEDRFAADAKVCSSRCSSPARLFVYNTDGGSPETMVDLKGNPYDKLPNAFLFRTKYNPSCKCAPHPWEAESQQRHASYKTRAWKKKARVMAWQERRKAKKQKHAARAARKWLEKLKADIGALEPEAPASGRSGRPTRTSARTHSVVRSSYRTRSERSEVVIGGARTGKLRAKRTKTRKLRPGMRLGAGASGKRAGVRRSSGSRQSKAAWRRRVLYAPQD